MGILARAEQRIEELTAQMDDDRTATGPGEPQDDSREPGEDPTY